MTGGAGLFGRAPREQPSDADGRLLRRTTTRIALSVAGVAFVLVAVGGLLFFAYLWWVANGPHGHGRRREGSGEEATHHITVSLDPIDLVVAAVVVGIVAVILAGVAAVIIANRAVAPLGQALQRERRFVADASHELRTPLSVLHARVQQLRMRTPKDDPSRPVVESLWKDSAALAGIVDELLADTAAASTSGRQGDDRRGRAGAAADEGSGAGRAGADRATANLGDALADLREGLGLLARERGVFLEVAGTSSTTSTDGAAGSDGADTTVVMSRVALGRCLTALTDNAIAHTPAGGTVRISAQSHGGWVTITVADNGTGITGIDPDLIFERFAHGTPAPGPAGGGAATGSRTPVVPLGGHGIGLALVRDLAEQHAGSVRLVATGASGTVFELRLRTVPGGGLSGTTERTTAKPPTEPGPPGQGPDEHRRAQ